MAPVQFSSPVSISPCHHDNRQVRWGGRDLGLTGGGREAWEDLQAREVTWLGSLSPGSHSRPTEQGDPASCASHLVEGSGD